MKAIQICYKIRTYKIPPPSASVYDRGRSEVIAQCIFITCALVHRYQHFIRVDEEFYPEDRGSRFQQNTGTYL